MIKATFFTEPTYFENKQFDISSEFNRDNCLNGFYELKKRFAEKGVDLSTQDINPPLEADFVIYNEMPNIKDVSSRNDNYLIILESVVVRPDNWKNSYHEYFKKIFTWNDDYIDGDKYIKIYYPNKVPEKLDFSLDVKEKFITMITAHKHVSDPRELYSERLKAIDWFENNQPEKFDLYGVGWDKYFFKGSFSFLNRFGFHRLLKFKYPSYKGLVDSKLETLKRYKYAICYENSRDIRGYVTEKIFDCFFAGCVPVYWGASNITDYIPKETFIDRRDFISYSQLYEFLNKISDIEYEEYLSNIKSFLKSDDFYPFTPESFADTLMNTILKD